MAIGTNRVYQLTPTDCSGLWHHTLTEVFGGTIYDTLGGAFTLRSISCQRTTGAGVVTTEVVHDGAVFTANWIAGSAYNPATGVFTLFRVGGWADGMQLMFTVCSRDGAVNDTYSTWYVGVGNPPETADPPVVGDKVKANGIPFVITSAVGAAGAVRYICEPLNHSVAGVMRLRRNDFEYISPRGRLDSRILISE